MKKLKIKFINCFLLLIFSLPSFAFDWNGFLPNTYHLIGKEVDSNTSYFGEATITLVDNKLQLIKNINGKQTLAEITITKAYFVGAEMVIIGFLDKPQLEQSCLAQFDLDNDARLTCYIYTTDRHTTNPGYEAYFPTNKPGYKEVK